MNKNQHRIVFNASRGLRMAVAETAASQGKSASGEGCSASMGIGTASAGRAVFTLAAGASLILLSGLLAPPVDAQIVADPNAPGNQRPTLLQTANGLPQVNIQTPSAAGVSRNTCSQFDVSSKGAILNNSRTDVNTQLGGYVQGNPWLATGSARVFLNEVNTSVSPFGSGSASQLKGFVEVAGQRAEVIIANPAGIAVNGGGFLNASAVTLTTGMPVMNAGNLATFQVRGGNVTVDGAGLDTSTADFTNILARAVQVNAGIWAKDLKVVTGANDISAASAATPSATASVAGAGATPAFALDVAALGGMYAGKIFLVGTEAGLGVRNGGVIGATAGDVVLSNNGWLSNSGSMYATGNTSITTQGDLTTTGSIAAKGNTSVNAQGTNGEAQASQVHASSSSVLAAGVDSTGAIDATGTLQISSAGNSALNGQLASGTDTKVTASAVYVIGANISVQGTFSAQAQTSLTTDNATINATQLSLAAHDLSNVGGKLQQSGTGDLTIALAGNLDNTHGLVATNSRNLSLTAATLNNAAGGSIQHAGTGTLTITASRLNGNAGTIVSNGALNLQGGAMDLTNATTGARQVAITGASLNSRGGQIVQTGTTADASITLTGALDNSAGSIFTSGNLNTTASSLTNTGSVYAGGDANVAVTGALTNSGTIAALGNASLSAQSLASTSTSLLAAGLKSD